MQLYCQCSGAYGRNSTACVQERPYAFVLPVFRSDHMQLYCLCSGAYGRISTACVQERSGAMVLPVFRSGVSQCRGPLHFSLKDYVTDLYCSEHFF